MDMVEYKNNRDVYTYLDIIVKMIFNYCFYQT